MRSELCFQRLSSNSTPTALALEFLGGEDDDASIAGAEVVDFFAGLDFAEDKHFFDEWFRGWGSKA